MNTFIKSVLPLWILVLGIALPFGASAEANPIYKDTTLEANAQNTFFDRLPEGKPLAITLTAPWDSLLADRWGEEYLPATIQYLGDRGVLQRLPVGIRARGRFRRRTCGFPPLKLNFKKSDLAAEGLQAEYDKYKLVTQCLDDERLANELVLREYLAYQLFEQLSPKSYRTRLVRITYQYPGGRIRSSGYGILLEETDELGARFGAEEAELFNPAPDSLDARQEMRVALFQYMIGNADWSYQQMRNLKLYRTADQSGYFAVPYDFDFSGLVNAPYARPSVELGQRYVGDRVFLGLNRDQELLRREIGYVLSKKASLYQTVQSLSLLSGAGRRDILDYLDAFFQTLERAQRNRNGNVFAQFQLPPEKASRRGRARMR